MKGMTIPMGTGVSLALGSSMTTRMTSTPTIMRRGTITITIMAMGILILTE